MPTLALVLAALAAMLLVLAVAMSGYGAGRDVSRAPGAAARVMKRRTQYDVGLMRDVKIVGADGVPVAMHRDLPLNAMGAVPTAEALEACRTDPGCVLVVANESMPFPGKGTRVEPVEVALPDGKRGGVMLAPAPGLAIRYVGTGSNIGFNIQLPAGLAAWLP